jgi:flagellar protein FlaG
MSVEIGYLTLASPPAPAAPAARPDTPATASPTGVRAMHDTVELAPIPSSPPPAVSEAVARAADRAAELAATNRELHFSVDEDSGRVIVEVRDLEGQVIRIIPPSEALDVMSGADLF